MKGNTVILGQGLAGTVVAMTLLFRGHSVQIVDDGYRKSSSRIAAGLWNPIVFRMINKGWRADQFTAALASFYPKCEGVLSANFYHPMPLHRIHSSALEKESWDKKQKESDFEDYLLNPPSGQSFDGFLEPPFGKGVVNHAGYLDVNLFLESARTYFQDLGVYHPSDFSLPETAPGFSDFKFNELPVAQFIDCRGYSAADSKWWSYLPFGLCKGEILTLKIEGLNLKELVNTGIFILPLGDDLYKVGSTFSWERMNEVPTETAKEDLLAKLKKRVTLPIEIINQEAGVRPTIKDRRPLLGVHPSVTKLSIFNGLGTKGVLLAPFLAGHFLDHLLQGAPLYPEVDIARFEKRARKQRF